MRLRKILPEQEVFFDPETAATDALHDSVLRGGGQRQYYSYTFVLTPITDFMCFKQSDGETCRPGTAARCASDGDLGSTVDFTPRRVLLGARYIMPRLFCNLWDKWPTSRSWHVT